MATVAADASIVFVIIAYNDAAVDNVRRMLQFSSLVVNGSSTDWFRSISVEAGRFGTPHADAGPVISSIRTAAAAETTITESFLHGV